MAKTREQDLEIALEQLRIELDSLKSKLDALTGSTREALDGIAVLSQEVATAKSKTHLTIGPELQNKIDPAQVYLMALQGAVQGLVAKNANPKAFSEHIDSNAKIALDVAMGVLKSYTHRHGVAV